MWFTLQLQPTKLGLQYLDTKGPGTRFLILAERASIWLEHCGWNHWQCLQIGSINTLPSIYQGQSKVDLALYVHICITQCGTWVGRPLRLAIQVHTHVTDRKQVQGLRNNIIQPPAYLWNAWGYTALNREWLQKLKQVTGAWEFSWKFNFCVLSARTSEISYALCGHR